MPHRMLLQGEQHFVLNGKVSIHPFPNSHFPLQRKDAVEEKGGCGRGKNRVKKKLGRAGQISWNVEAPL